LQAMCSATPQHHPRPILSPCTTLFRSPRSSQRSLMHPITITILPEASQTRILGTIDSQEILKAVLPPAQAAHPAAVRTLLEGLADRKSTRLNSSHVKISYAVFCLKKKR